MITDLNGGSANIRNDRHWSTVCTSFCLFLTIGFAASAQAPYEAPSTLDAVDFLSQDLMTGPHHAVLRSVQNDGYMNSYIISTPFGEVEATSTQSVPARIHEVNAIAAMEETKKTDAFKLAAKNTASEAIEGAKDLVTQPVATVRGAATGVGRFFQRSAQAASFRERSDAEDPAYQALLGFSQAKRAVAEEFGVDVYSSNELLQNRLNDLARVQYAGSLVVKAPLAYTGGTAGAIVSTTQTVTNLNRLIANTPPEELRIRNRDSLQTMGVHGDVIELFLNNSLFTPRQQTILVGALEEMSNTKNRGEFIKFAVTTDSEDLAAYRQRAATLFASYDSSKDSIQEFVEVGDFVAGRTVKGDLVMVVPVDYLVWTATTSEVVNQLDAVIERLGVEGEKQLWLEGASLRAAQELEKRGWRIHVNASQELASAS